VLYAKYVAPGFFISLGLSAIAGLLLGSLYSIYLGLIMGAVAPAVLLNIAHNKNPIIPKIRERYDRAAFEMCAAGGLTMFRRLYSHLPSEPRCRLCLIPFGGLGKILRIQPSRKNPNFCIDCLEGAPVGVHKMEVGILFADIRGFTSWSEEHEPDAVVAELTRFYSIASRVLSKDDALVEFVGDQIMALYLPIFPSLGKRTSEVMLSAATRLIRELEDPKNNFSLQIGIGINSGASVGNVGKGQDKDFTAVGDVVNTTARLQSQAKAGQVVLSREVYESAKAFCPNAKSVSFSVKGKSQPLEAHVFSVSNTS
jgi:adenylate cyclase